MLALLDGIRRIVNNWAITTVKLTADAAENTDIVQVASTRRFYAGDEILIKGVGQGGVDRMENRIRIAEIIDDTHFRVSSPLLFTWTTAADSAVVKTFNDMHVKRIFFGEPDVITLDQLPAITVHGTGKNSEYMTIRGTKERYNVEIGIFVDEGSQEAGYRFLLELTGRIEKGLKRNFYPLLDDYAQTVLTEDVSVGDKFIKVADTSLMSGYSTVILESQFDVQEFQICPTEDPNVIDLHNFAAYNFPADTTTVIIPRRFIYNSWPADIDYAKIHKGTLMKAAVIKFFAEEYEPQFEASWFDTQLR